MYALRPRRDDREDCPLASLENLEPAMTDSAPIVSLRHDAGLLCPVCRVDLVMTDRQGVEIDYCPKCRGVWLDRGELDKIIERSAAHEDSLTRNPPPREQAAPGPWDNGRRDEFRGKHGGGHGSGGHGSSQGGYGGHRRRGFLGGLFDH